MERKKKRIKTSIVDVTNLKNSEKMVDLRPRRAKRNYREDRLNCRIGTSNNPTNANTNNLPQTNGVLQQHQSGPEAGGISGNPAQESIAINPPNNETSDNENNNVGESFINTENNQVGNLNEDQNSNISGHASEEGGAGSENMNIIANNLNSIESDTAPMVSPVFGASNTGTVGTSYTSFSCAKTRFLRLILNTSNIRVREIMRTVTEPQKKVIFNKYMDNVSTRGDLLHRTINREYPEMTKTARATGLKNLQLFNELDDRIFPYLNINDYPYHPKQMRVAPKTQKTKKLAVGKSSKHGFGVFTMQDLKQNDFIVEYIGEILEKPDLDQREDGFTGTRSLDLYAFSYGSQDVNEAQAFDVGYPPKIVDATYIGNESRFLNHSCSPNCEAKTLFQDWKSHHILIHALMDIPAGTELTICYFLKCDDGDAPIPCHCEAQNCSGVIGAPA